MTLVPRPEIALFGGSFDPPHIGHVLLAAYALSAFGVEEVLAVPVFTHAFEKPLSPFHHRMQMAVLAFELLPDVRVLGIEEELGAPSRTIRTLEELERRDPGRRFRLLMGADLLVETEKWLAWDEIVKRGSPLVVGRAGISHPDAPAPVLPDVSSTRIRAALRADPSDASTEKALRDFVPKAVREYITAHRLYR